MIERTPGTAKGEESSGTERREESTGIDRRDDSTTIEMRVASGRGLVRFILSWAPDVEVLSPPELFNEVAEAHRSALERLV